MENGLYAEKTVYRKKKEWKKAEMRVRVRGRGHFPVDIVRRRREKSEESSGGACEPVLTSPVLSHHRTCGAVYGGFKKISPLSFQQTEATVMDCSTALS